VKRPLRDAEAIRAASLGLKNIMAKLKEKPKEITKIHKNSKFDLRYIELAEKLKAAGFTNDNLAYVFGVYDHSRIQEWMKRHPELRKAIENGRESARKKLIAKGLQSAWGYDYEEANEKWEVEKVGLGPKGKGIPLVDENGNSKMILKSKSIFKKHKPPDPKLMCTFLAVLDPEFRHIWQRADAVSRSVTLKIDGKLESKKLEELAGKLLEEDSEESPRKLVLSQETGGGAC